MKRRLRLKSKVKEVIELITAGIAVSMIGFMILSMMSIRFHSDDVIEMQKKTELSVTQISQK